jgi:arylsulfatase A-like enzyme
MKRITGWILTLALCAGFGLYAATGIAAPRPNIVLIMVDDMGYSDIASYGGDIETPNLDQLAADGLRFSQFYNSARCCPTRASLMTGLFPHQTGIGHMTETPKGLDTHNRGYYGYRGFINKNCVTIAEVLKPAGYHTYMAGKWHLGMHSADRWPLQRGFERFYGITAGASSYLDPQHPRGLLCDNMLVQPEGDDYYTTDAFTDNAITFVEEQEDDKPFFLYLAYTAPHWPLQAKPKDIAKFEGRYMKGWDALRAERHQRQLDMGLLSSDWPLSPRDARAWDDLNAKQKKEMAYRMAVYAAQIYAVDYNIGKLVDVLKRQGKLDNTLILFLTDNGGCAEGGELGGGKYSDINNPAISSNVSYGRAWANASNTPFRRYKHYVHEGGISTPLIAHWPAVISEKRGAITHAPGYLIDVMSTVIDISGAEYPQEVGGKVIHPLEGKSLTPVFETGEREGHEWMYWEHEDNCAVRNGKWKAVQKFSTDKWELYDLDADRTELNNLADAQPERTQRMADKWHAWARTHFVVPKGELKKK